MDGEIVALDNKGGHSFQLLQRIGGKRAPTEFHIFDLLHLENQNLMGLPLRERRARLESAFRKLPAHLRLSPVLDAPVSTLLSEMRKFGFEDVVGKRMDSVYQPGQRTGLWVKQKTQQEDEFVIGGFANSNPSS